ncbi:hypothetical protein BT63DRAFT_302052 [Microthyrium microscopicum]|uniref:Uncharacterized protein n=1 Tax=Microthyrium microscopicum TaxID=703497 RepID=A0A6A6U864_9PEZI|nr:hypothetical protein BT63DRAFT_302052 [Microthyrium microscopicum]
MIAASINNPVLEHVLTLLPAPNNPKITSQEGSLEFGRRDPVNDNIIKKDYRTPSISKHQWTADQHHSQSQEGHPMSCQLRKYGAIERRVQDLLQWRVRLQSAIWVGKRDFGPLFPRSYVTSETLRRGRKVRFSSERYCNIGSEMDGLCRDF